jgi:hypothetical protein
VADGLHLLSIGCLPVRSSRKPVRIRVESYMTENILFFFTRAEHRVLTGCVTWCLELIVVAVRWPAASSPVKLAGV